MKLKVGDKVKVVNGDGKLRNGDVYTIQNVLDDIGLILGEKINNDKYKKTKFLMDADIAEEIFQKVVENQTDNNDVDMNTIRKRIKELDLGLCALYDAMDNLGEEIKKLSDQIDETVDTFQLLCDEVQVDWSDKE